jgi:hypothetical protein
VTEYKFGTGHNVKLSNTSILYIVLGYMDHLIQKTTQISPHHRNFNKDTGLNPIWSWYSVTNMIKVYCNKPIWIQSQDNHMSPPTSTPLVPVFGI